jgi:hypothetical protein
MLIAPPTALPSAAPASPAPPPLKASMTVPKGWLRVQGDTVATIVLRSPSAPQDIRIAPIGAAQELTGDAGVQKVRQMAARFLFPQIQVTQTVVCAGKQPAIQTVAKNASGQTVMEQLVVVGTTGGAIITYEIIDGKPDAEAENALRSVCIP